jgi:hypothetical protein
MFRRSLFLVAIALVSLCFVGCGPRGETKTLDEVLANAKLRFVKVGISGSSQEVQGILGEVQKNLETMASGDVSSAVPALETIASSLNSLVSKSGYTVRPSMGEIMAQYRALAEQAGHGSVSAAQLKLLAARTYELIASELETTRFGV